MKQKVSRIATLFPGRLVLGAVTIIVVALAAAPRVGAALNGGTCIDDVTGRTNNCTANDVRIGELRNIEDVTCEAGTLVEVSLRARLVAGSQGRYDIGTFVALDGGNARTGTCQHDYLPPPLSAGGTCSGSGVACHWDGDCPAGEICTDGYDPLSGTGPFFNAEAEGDPGDLCGDIEQSVETFYDLVTVTVPCEDTNGDGYLDIGTCLSWDKDTHSTCVDVNGAIPGTKSKCSCEMTTVGNVIVHGALSVVKDAEPESLPEDDGDVQFTFTVTNPSSATITLDTLDDSIYGDLTAYAGTSCVVPQTLAPSASYACAITAPVSGPPGVQIDTVTASGLDQNGDPVSDTAVAQVTITDLLPSIVVTKTVEPGSLREPGGWVTYTVGIKNSSARSDPVTLASLPDSLYGELTAPLNPKIVDSTCQLIVIDPGSTYECTFKAQVTGAAGDVIMDTVTAFGVDDEANPVQASDDAAVTIVPSMTIEVTKSVAPDCVAKAGDPAVYTVVVTNPNQVPLDLISLSDDIYGDLSDPDNPKISESTCELATIEPTASYTCTFTAAVVIGQADLSLTDTVTAQATDRAGKTLQGSDDATVSLCIQPPDTGVALPAPFAAGGLAVLGVVLAGAGVWLRRRAR
jgi:hypothetical protein